MGRELCHQHLAWPSFVPPAPFAVVVVHHGESRRGCLLPMSERRAEHHDIAAAISHAGSDIRDVSGLSFDEDVAAHSAVVDNLCDHRMSALSHSQVGLAKYKANNSRNPDHP